MEKRKFAAVLGLTGAIPLVVWVIKPTGIEFALICSLFIVLALIIWLFPAPTRHTKPSEDRRRRRL